MNSANNVAKWKTGFIRHKKAFPQILFLSSPIFSRLSTCTLRVPIFQCCFHLAKTGFSFFAVYLSHCVTVTIKECTIGYRNRAIYSSLENYIIMRVHCAFFIFIFIYTFQPIKLLHLRSSISRDIGNKALQLQVTKPKLKISYSKNRKYTH